MKLRRVVFEVEVLEPTRLPGRRQEGIVALIESGTLTLGKKNSIYFGLSYLIFSFTTKHTNRHEHISTPYSKKVPVSFFFFRTFCLNTTI